MANDEKIKELKVRRGSIKGQLTRFAEFVDKITDINDVKINEIPLRLSKIQKVLAEFDSVQDELEVVDVDNAELHAAERSLFEDKYFAVVAKANQLLDAKAGVAVSCRTASEAGSGVDDRSVAGSQRNWSQPQFNVKLPQLSLPEYHGSYDKWAQFYDTFKTLIDENPSLNDITKFYYLQSSLKGEAAQVISALEVSAANYSIAWELLKNRFENKKIIIKTHIKNIFELSSVTRDSHTSLRQFLDAFQKNFRALKNLNENVEQWNTLLLYLLTSKLDVNTKREWEIHTSKEIAPTIDTFIEFITNRCHLLESLDNKNAQFHSSSFNVKKGSDSKPQTHVVVNKEGNFKNHKCILCKNEHQLFQCSDFIKLPVSQRISEAKRLKACLNCLKRGHSPQECYYGSCRTCNKKHNTLLHLNIQPSNRNTQQAGSSNSNNHAANSQTRANNEIENATNTQEAQQINNTVSTYCTNSTFVLLSTAQLYILDNSNKPVLCRALLDSGSQSCFITSHLCELLNLGYNKTVLPVIGINAVSTNITGRVKATIKSTNSKFRANLEFLTINQITEKIPQMGFEADMLNIPDNIRLADPKFSEPGNIDILLGASVFFGLLSDGRINLAEGGPVLQNSKLGWIIAGPLNVPCNYHVTSCNFIQSDLNQQIERFWLIEEGDKKHVTFTKEEEEVEKHFCESVKRDQSGRFVVRLPVKENYAMLGDNLQESIKRFHSVERKFVKDPTLKIAYSNFIKEYIDLDHMTKINPQNDREGDIIHYLPHHSIKKEASLTTKLRVVFDASSKSHTNLSLNEVLKTGPCIQEDIISILLQFRTHNVAFTADIAKMYRQILVDERDRDLQRIVWRFNTSDELGHYKLNTVTYGTSPASFLATRCLRQLALENKSDYPEASFSLERNFYMDDWLGGASDIESAICLIQEVDKILRSAGFVLRQWVSNNIAVLQNISLKADQLQYNIKDDSNLNKTLGVNWNASEDSFQFAVNFVKSSVVTKRYILSKVSQIFDPLGLIGPVILTSKLIMQQLWQLKSDWDDPVPHSKALEWFSFFNNINSLKRINIPRQIILKDAVHTELHCFCDASQSAYGTCLYARSINKEGQVLVRLICSKSRVAPLKTVTLPRLELCGALLAAQLANRVIPSLNLNINDHITFWCDSSITLAWIASEPSRFKTFVSNRIAQIQSLTKPDQWRYLPTAMNVADYISRGLQPQEINGLTCWWQGPQFLHQDPANWPINITTRNAVLPEIKKSRVISLPVEVKNFELISRFSSFKKLTHVVAYMLRFFHNCRTAPNDKKVGALSLMEIDTSINYLVKLVQRECFSQEIKSLKKSQCVAKNSKLYNLHPFLDQEGIIRVGGRLAKSDYDFNFKHPMIIPSKHQLTSLIIKHEHAKNLHAGCQTVLASIRSRFWPLNGRQTVKSVLRNCIICFRVKPCYLKQIMGQLPSARIKPSRPFATCGVDFAGPYLVKDSKFRNKKLIKAYICIFVCFASKAVHIEPVSDLTTEGFLNALKRFISRRGLCSDIYSDNATNFVGANKHLQQFVTLAKEPAFQRYLMDNRVTWHFIPPRTPHFGGLWESAVRCAKYHLRRIIHNVTLTFEEIYTYLAQVEAILNSRPLYPLTEDPEDISPLTPGHFIIGTALNALPEQPVQDVRGTHVNRYKHLQLLLQQFWTKWSKTYLHTLQQATKWHYTNMPEKLVGSLVLIHEENTPPMNWKLGRVISTHPGSDGRIRVVSVKTANNVLKRSIAKISVLPAEQVD